MKTIDLPRIQSLSLGSTGCHRLIKGWLIGWLAVHSVTFCQAEVPDTKQAVLAALDQRYEQTASMAQAMWDYAELGYQETQSSALLQKTLEAEGFELQRGVAEIPTAFVASWGSGQPVIAILAEFDALPGISQAASPTQQAIPGKDSAQACGHHLLGAGSTAAAMAVKQWLQHRGQAGTVRLYGTPAEEGGSGKVYMVRAGLFDDVDFALHWHPASINQVVSASSLANRSAKFRFRGVSAHAAGAPELGRSALDGLEAFNHMVNLMREHVPQDTRMHYVITQGGRAPNVVPNFAEAFYYVRHPQADVVKQIWQRVERAALGAAQGTGTEVTWEVIHGNHALLINQALAEMVDDKLHQVGGIHYSPAEQAFAETLYPSLPAPDFPLGSQARIQPYVADFNYGSTDVGDVSMIAPTAGFYAATWVPGTGNHSWQAVAAGGMSIGHKGAHMAAKVLALSAIELFENPALREMATAEFQRSRGKDFHYTSLVGDRRPPLDYRY